MFAPLTVAAILFICSLLSYAAAMQLIVNMAVRFARNGYKELGFWSGTAIMGKVAIIMAAAHLTQITLWSVAIVLCGQIPSFQTAFYFSAQNYATLGYGDVLLSEQWRLLGPLEAINGVLFFGLSTSVMFASLSQLIANRLRAETSHRHDSAGSPQPLSIVGEV